MMPLIRSGTAWLSGLALVAGVTFAPQTAEAGDKEWATAGKILTGVAGLYVLGNVLDGGPSYGSVHYSSSSHHRHYRPSYSYGYSYRHRPHYGYSYHYSHRPRYSYSYSYHDRHRHRRSHYGSSWGVSYTYSVPRYSSYYYESPRPAPQVVYNYHVQEPRQPERPVTYTQYDDGGDYYTPRDRSYYAGQSQSSQTDRVVVERQPQTEVVVRDRNPAPDTAAAPTTTARLPQDVQQTPTDQYVVAAIGEDRRIVQVRERGAQAVLQQYSEVHQRWVDVKPYPSIW